MGWPNVGTEKLPTRYKQHLWRAIFPQCVCVHAAKNCTTLYNLSLEITALDKCFPFDFFTGRILTIKHLRSFGCAAWYHVPAVERNKLNEPGRPCIMLYYLNNGSGYVMWEIIALKPFKLTHVRFIEKMFSGTTVAEKLVASPYWVIPWPEVSDEGVTNAHDINEDDIGKMENPGKPSACRLTQVRFQPVRLGNNVALSSEVTSEKLVNIDPTTCKKILQSNEVRK